MGTNPPHYELDIHGILDYCAYFLWTTFQVTFHFHGKKLSLQKHLELNNLLQI